MVKIFSIFALLFFILITPKQIFAEEKTSVPSANLGAIEVNQGRDTRGIALKKYLEKNDSPLASFAYIMVEEADKNAIPWDLVAAISGTEGTFGKFEPSPTCNNTWGWGIYGTNVMCFPSYTEAIQTISKELRTRFIDQYRCRNIEDIGKFYASSDMWATHTRWFAHQIEEFKANYDRQSLSISL